MIKRFQNKFLFIFIDEEPPSYGNTCPQDITMYTSDEHVYVTWTAPTFTDNSGKSTTSAPSRSSTYPVGTTIISYSATDEAGLTTTCSFNITVISKYPYDPRSVIKYFVKGLFFSMYLVLIFVSVSLFQFRLC